MLLAFGLFYAAGRRSGSSSGSSVVLRVVGGFVIFGVGATELRDLCGRILNKGWGVARDVKFAFVFLCVMLTKDGKMRNL